MVSLEAALGQALLAATGAGQSELVAMIVAEQRLKTSTATHEHWPPGMRES